MTETDTQIHKGLAGVVVDTTEVSSVDAASNSLLYRGYPVQQLAAQCSFEQVAYLLWHGELPTGDQLAQLQQAERSQRVLDDDVVAGGAVAAHHLPPDGRGAHGGERPRRARPDRGGLLARGQPRQVGAAARAAARASWPSTSAAAAGRTRWRRGTTSASRRTSCTSRSARCRTRSS